MFLLSLYKTDNQKLSKLYSKDFKHECIGINVKQKTSEKIRQTNIDISTNQNLQESSGCLFWFIQISMTVLLNLKLDITYQKTLSRITMSLSMKKAFMTKQLILI